MTRNQRPSGPWRVEEYRTAAGNSPVRDFLANLGGTTLVRAAALIAALGERGRELRPPLSRPLGGGLFELRDPPSGVRIFYVFAGRGRIVLLDGLLKKRDAMPSRAMARLRSLQREVAGDTRRTR